MGQVAVVIAVGLWAGEDFFVAPVRASNNERGAYNPSWAAAIELKLLIEIPGQPRKKGVICKNRRPSKTQSISRHKDRQQQIIVFAL
jgi:hypothetical protein